MDRVMCKKKNLKARIYCDDENWVFEVQDGKMWKVYEKYNKQSTDELATRLITELELLQFYGYDIEIYTYNVYSEPVFNFVER